MWPSLNLTAAYMKQDFASAKDNSSPQIQLLRPISFLGFGLSNKKDVKNA
jgi:hypothetical protein